MVWVVALDGTARVVVMAPWTSPWVATVVATAVIPVVETRGGGATPPRITFNLVDRRGPISWILEFSLVEFSKFLANCIFFLYVLSKNLCK